MLKTELTLAALVLAACGDKQQPAPAPTPVPAIAIVPPRDAAPAIDAPAVDAEEPDPEALERARQLAAWVATLPPVYAPIFAGTAKNFPGETMFEFPLEIRQDTEVETGQARCFVQPVVFSQGVIGSVICAPFGMGGEVLLFTFDGYFIATRDGLWFEMLDSTDEDPKLDPRRMILAANHAPRRHVRVEDGKRTTFATTRHGDLWCTTATTRGSSEFLCLEAGVGIVGGGGTGAGIAADKRTETWGKVPNKGW